MALKLNVKKVIGKNGYVFQVEGNNLFDVMMESQRLSFNDVYKCGLCESDKLYVRAYVTEKEKYEYIKICCAECRGSLTFGKAREKKDTYFLRRNEDKTYAWQPYEEGEKKGNGGRAPGSTEEETPF